MEKSEGGSYAEPEMKQGTAPRYGTGAVHEMENGDHRGVKNLPEVI